MKKLILFPLLLCLITLTVQTQNVISPESLWELGRVSLMDVSPDGSTIVYGVARYDVEANSGQQDLYSLSTLGGVARKITAFESFETGAQFRPDGERIGFLRNGYLWEMNPDGTDKKRISNFRMGGFRYAPTGDRILFFKEVQFGKTTLDHHPDLPMAEVHIIDDLMYRHWDKWYEGKHRNIFYIEYNDGELVGNAVNIMDEPFDSPMKPFGGMNQIAWSPDGRKIAYTCKKKFGRDYTLTTNSNIYLYDLSSGETEDLTPDNDGYDRNPTFSPDGRYIMWNSMERDGFESDRNRIFIHDFQTGERREISEGWDRNADNPQFNEDGTKVYFTSGVHATFQIFEYDIAGGAKRQLTDGIHNFYSFFVRGDFIIASKSTMSLPDEIFRVEIANGTDSQLSSVNTEMLSEIDFGEVKSEWVETTDGKQMLVWMIYPPGFDPNKKYPTILYCQGGPQSPVSQFFSYRWNFQMMASDGYIVVAPNRRGLPSFGREWNDAISEDWGGQAMLDYLSAIDHAAEKSYVDETRLGAVGASFGGYSVFWLAGNHEGRFRSFISHCGLFNLDSWYASTEEQFFANWDIGGAFWDEPVPESYLMHSPHLYAGNWDTPILVIHGEQDFRVPIGEGIQAFHTAQLQGIKSRFLYFPTEGHWVLQPQNSVLWHREFIRWLDETLKN
ncbi:MAG: S9 family peptidase [Saprospirales bacterium]|nr:MAG: S9 family peptidase [Saprospirales bacterium]